MKGRRRGGGVKVSLEFFWAVFFVAGSAFAGIISEWITPELLLATNPHSPQEIKSPGSNIVDVFFLPFPTTLFPGSQPLAG